MDYWASCFWARLAQKSAHVSCLGRQTGKMTCEGTTRWHAGHTGRAYHGPMPCRAGPACCSTLDGERKDIGIHMYTVGPWMETRSLPQSILVRSCLVREKKKF